MLIRPHERVLVRSSQEERGDERNKFTARLQEPACRCMPVGCWHCRRSAGYWSERLKMNWKNGKNRRGTPSFLVQIAAGTLFFPAIEAPLSRSEFRQYPNSVSCQSSRRLASSLTKAQAAFVSAVIKTCLLQIFPHLSFSLRDSQVSCVFNGCVAQAEYCIFNHTLVLHIRDAHS